MTPNDATRAQIAAADPDVSTWLTANAGSGKTRVLTDRVARLLLNGVPPQRILCLTYTKAAASEMQNRLFARLGDWAMKPDAELARSLSELGVEPGLVSPDTLREARRLFAKAIEAPGGLKIQTIHSFCAALLRRFPLEAGVSPSFVEMDDRAAKMLRANVLEQIAKDHPSAMAGLAQYFSGDDVDRFLQEISGKRQAFNSKIDTADLLEAFGQKTELDTNDLIGSVFLGSEASLIATTVQALRTCKPGGKDQELAETLASVDADTPTLGLLEKLEGAFLTASGKAPGTPKGFPPTKEGKAAIGDQLDAFNQFRERVADARPRRLAYEALQKTKALHGFARTFLPMVEQRKQAMGMLDFDDLILKAGQLLTDPGVAAWVLFKLDGGIDHILVDEAQDTSPDQWDVVRLLAQEFTSGDGAREGVERTIFVVGDQKQSIYSFQGADPAGFERMRSHFGDALSKVNKPLERQDLLYSFRSAKPILDLVDASFSPELREGMGVDVCHLAFKENLPGKVELWPWVEPSDKEPDKQWFDPVDTIAKNHHNVILAEQIAHFIEDRLEFGQITILDKDGTPQTRPIEPRDFLLLVQRRSGLFHEIIRACKSRRLPMAGADRMKVGAELAVKDLTALLSYLATPEDDLSLATVMRSPLGGMSEAQLYELAHGRKGYLRPVFEDNKDRFAGLYEMLQDLRKQADFLRPYELLERALTRYDGRRLLLARLGQEADEGIDALLDQALRYEQNDVPSVTGFLTWLASDEVTIKRQIDSSSNKIRVMTVHGAKGLEAPIVILPDTSEARNDVKQNIFDIGGIPMWKASSKDMPDVQKDHQSILKQRQAEERMRLLYVAMTRAENWLVVCGAGKRDNASSWYNIIDAGLDRCNAVETAEGKQLAYLTWPDDQQNIEKVFSDPPNLPDWATQMAHAPKKSDDVLFPSELGGAKVLPGPTDGLSEDEAKARGTAIHMLLEHLPQVPKEDWQGWSDEALAKYDNALNEDLLAIAKRCLENPALADIFGPAAMAEIPITAALDALGGARMSGSIDRLLVKDDHVLAVDFKSNVRVPARAEDVPEGLLRQMGAYAAALAQIYPDRRIETAIIWTESAQIMQLPHDIVSQALCRTHIS